MAKLVRLFIVVLAFTLAACGKSPTSPSGPDPVPVARDGMVTFTYVRSGECTRLCFKKPRLADDRWPEEYKLRAMDPVTGMLLSPEMVEQADGSWALTVKVPAGVRGVSVLDGNELANGGQIGQRISANGVRLFDKNMITYFEYTPPERVEPK